MILQKIDLESLQEFADPNSLLGKQAIQMVQDMSSPHFQLKQLGVSELQLRPAKGKDGPVITENGNLILDARFDEIGDDLEKAIKSITGVIESGLFIDHHVEIIVA